MRLYLPLQQLNFLLFGFSYNTFFHLGIIFFLLPLISYNVGTGDSNWRNQVFPSIVRMSILCYFHSIVSKVVSQQHEMILIVVRSGWKFCIWICFVSIGCICFFSFWWRRWRFFTEFLLHAIIPHGFSEYPKIFHGGKTFILLSLWYSLCTNFKTSILWSPASKNCSAYGCRYRWNH